VEFFVTTPQTVLICYLALFCLGPLTLYLCWIASINRRSRPTVVAGVWDFAFLMVGLLGFILVGCILAVSLFGFVSYYLQRANFANLAEDWHTHHFIWSLVSVVYLAAVGIPMLISFLKRQGTLCVYNVDLADVEIAIEDALTRCKMAPDRIGNRWANDTVRLKYLHGSYNATISLNAPGPIREELERGIRERLKAVDSSENTIGAWCTSLAMGSTMITAVMVAVLVITKFYR
jgi:hypothetical protein